MRSYNPAGWASFFTALTGLLFVKGGRFLPARGALLGIVGAVYGAWVLLVEIVR